MHSFTAEETRASNHAFLERFYSDDSTLVKSAQSNMDDYIRMILREEGFMSYFLPSEKISDDQLDQQIEDNYAVKIVSREPFSPAAVTVPLNKLPRNFYIRQDKFPVFFARIMTPRMTVDVDTLRGARIDLRQIISDNMLKDLMYEEDSTFLGTVNTILHAPGTVLGATGVAQWQEVRGGWTRESVSESPKILRNTVANISAVRCLINHITVCNFMKWDRIEAGGDLSQQMLTEGFSRKRFMDLDWTVTIKKLLVPTNTQYLFAEEKFLGKHFEITPVTMGLKREFFFIEAFAYKYSGASIGNVAGVGRVDYL